MKKLYIREDPEPVAVKVREEEKETIITNPETIEAIEEGRRLAKNGKPGFKTMEELWAYVWSDGE